MEEQTLHILNECSSGCKMAIHSMQQILEYVENEKLELALKIIEENSKARTQYATLPSACGAMHGLLLAPIEVKVGGATVFVLDVEQFHRY